MGNSLFTAVGDTTAVDTAITGMFDQLTSTLSGVIVPALISLVIIGIVVSLGLKWVKRGASRS